MACSIPSHGNLITMTVPLQWWIGYHAPMPVFSSNFNGTPTTGQIPFTVQFTDLSTGNPTSWGWFFGDGYISTEQNPIHTYQTTGIYDVKLNISRTGESNYTIKSSYITALATDNLTQQHLDIDVRDYQTASLIPNSYISMYDISNNVWQNKTCINGACGWMDSGSSHEFPLALNHQYTLYATAPDYNQNSQTVTYTVDHQLTTLNLTYSTTINRSEVKHLDIDFIDYSTNAHIQDVNYQLWDSFYGNWTNKTCSSGACE